MKFLLVMMIIRFLIELMTSNKKSKETLYREKKSTHAKHPAEFQLR